MNQEQSKKRNTAFIVYGAMIVVFLGLLLVAPLLPSTIRPSKKVYLSFLLPAAFIVPLFFWFKGIYHWAKGKGYTGAFALIGIFGFPIAVIVLALMKDRDTVVVPVEEPSKNCPNCGGKYLLSDYNPDAKSILCSVCKAELPRE